MAVIDIAGKTLTVKLVYYGCALGGKTTNLATLHRLTDPGAKQGLVSIATNDDRTLFFDLLPMELGQIGGFTVRVKLYTVPGQVHYELTRRQVLGGADGVVLVVDSDPASADMNAWALKNLRYNLKTNGLDPDGIPTALQWNKRDLPNARPVSELEAELNTRGLPTFEAVATTGTGVVETFASVLKAAITHTHSKTGRTPPSKQLIDRTVDEALAQARSLEPELERPDGRTFEHRFDMDAYREDQAERGHDRRVMDQETLLSEAVNTNMMLAEKLDGLKRAEALGDRRARMMEALSRLAPMLADPAADALPAGVMALMLQGSGRAGGSLLLFRPAEQVMEDREIVPDGDDPLNASVTPGLGSIAYRLAQPHAFRVFEDLDTEVFFGDTPPGARELASLLIAPLGCDGLQFGAFMVYGRITEPAFDPTEREYWTTASCLVGLSLHWHALRNKLSQAKVAS